MDLFSLRSSLIDGYSAFARSFTHIGADDIRSQVDQTFDSGRYWPQPLIQINPRFKPGKSITEHVAAGELHSGTERIFQAGGEPRGCIAISPRPSRWREPATAMW